MINVEAEAAGHWTSGYLQTFSVSTEVSICWCGFVGLPWHFWSTKDSLSNPYRCYLNSESLYQQWVICTEKKWPMCSISTFYLWNLHDAYFFILSLILEVHSQDGPSAWAVDPLLHIHQSLGSWPAREKALCWEPLAPPELSWAAQSQRAALSSAESATPQQRKRITGLLGEQVSQWIWTWDF